VLIRVESNSHWLLLVVLAAVGNPGVARSRVDPGWHDTLWVGIFPLNGDGTPLAQRYVEGLSVKDFADIEDFFAREAHRYGVRWRSRYTWNSTR